MFVLKFGANGEGLTMSSIRLIILLSVIHTTWTTRRFVSKAKGVRFFIIDSANTDLSFA